MLLLILGIYLSQFALIAVFLLRTGGLIDVFHYSSAESNNMADDQCDKTIKANSDVSGIGVIHPPPPVHLFNLTCTVQLALEAEQEHCVIDFDHLRRSTSLVSHFYFWSMYNTSLYISNRAISS